MARTLVIAAALGQKPRHGGHAWVLLQYLLGFRRLGWDVLFLDRAVGADAATGAATAASVAAVLEPFGLGHSFAVLFDDGRTLGLPRAEVLDRCRRSAAMFNMMGFVRDPGVLAAAPLRVFLDVDPGFPQMWAATTQYDGLDGHVAFVTVGRNVGLPGCVVPTAGRSWITTAPPVVLDHWPAVPPVADAPFTSVASWRGAYGTVPYDGQTFGLRVHEFRRFLGVPGLVPGVRFELALDIHAGDDADAAALRSGGWSLVAPAAVAGDPVAYRAYLARSAGEFGVAKHLYVATAGGWFSDRSACYLASGRPVVAQDTGWPAHYPTGAGLLSFATPDGAAAAVESVRSDPARHAKAARQMAEQCFGSDRVLARLLAELGIA